MDPLTLITVVIAIVSVMATGFAYFRSAAVKVWEQNSQAYKARVSLLEDQNTSLIERIALLEARIKELESRPNWEAVVANSDRIIEAVHKDVTTIVQEHEARMATVAATLAALNKEAGNGA